MPVLDHDERGALGLVVNHPGRNAVAEVFGGLGLRWRGPAAARVRVGGPVEPKPRLDPARRRGLGSPARAGGPAGPVADDLLDQVTAAGHHDTGARRVPLMFLLGYAGWAPLQLEGEIAAGSWVPVPIGEGGLPATWLFHAQPDAMWHEALRAIGIDPGRMLGLSSGTGTA
ncbi:MAG: YqgE/AlgH family protein [Nannocystaceae bacterium]